MKQINSTKSEVYLSTYDNSDILLPVSEDHKNIKNVCVAVKFGGILIKISPNNTCKCSWNDAVEKHCDKLMHPAYWQIVGTVYHEVNQAIGMLGHEPIVFVWTDAEEDNYSSSSAWYYNGTHGYLYAYLKYNSYNVRAALAFQL